MGDESSTQVLVWRMPTKRRVQYTAMFALFPGFCVLAAVFEREWQAAVAAVVLGALAGFGATMMRQRCTLDDEKLVLQGRFARRTVELKDLRQVALTMSQFAWVQTHHPVDRHGTTVLRLAVIPSVDTWGSGPMEAKEAVPIIRKRAVAAGAKLQPMPARWMAPPLMWRGLFFGR